MLYFLICQCEQHKKYHYSFSWLCNSQNTANFILRQLLIQIYSKAITNKQNEPKFFRFFCFCFPYLCPCYSLIKKKGKVMFYNISSSLPKKPFQDIELPKQAKIGLQGLILDFGPNLEGTRETCSFLFLFSFDDLKYLEPPFACLSAQGFVENLCWCQQYGPQIRLKRFWVFFNSEPRRVFHGC